MQGPDINKSAQEKSGQLDTTLSISPHQCPSEPWDAMQAPAIVRRLIRACALALLATLLLTSLVLVLVNQPLWWRGLLPATLVMILATAASILPLALGLARSLHGAVAGYFTAAGLRLVIALGGCLLAVYVGQYPAAPTLLLMVPYYFAVLAAESAVVAKAIWTSRA